MSSLIGTVFSLLSDRKTNRPLYRYRIHHYLKTAISPKKAANIAKDNRKEYDELGVKLFEIETYEGSNQACHPDVIRWNENYWLSITPYPYGMEEYENPCIYTGSSFEKLSTYGDAKPIDVPEFKGYRTHLSDPCLFVFHDKLNCLYRSTVNDKGAETNYLFYKTSDGQGRWSDRKLLYKSERDQLLSPAMVFYDDNHYLFFVSCIDGALRLKRHTVEENLTISSQKEAMDCCIDNLPTGFAIWHIGITRNDNERLSGLFLLKDLSQQYSFHLFLSTSKNDGRNWMLLNEILPDDSIKDLIKIPYKSSFIPGQKKILYSYKDIKDRFFLKILEIEEER